MDTVDMDTVDMNTVDMNTAGAEDRGVAAVALGRRWMDLTGGGAAHAARAGKVLTGLLAAWREPHRRYHTVAHLEAVLDRIDDLDPAGRGRAAREPGGGLFPSGAARLAAWYHDAVYRPASHDNEDASAAMARRDLVSLGWGVRAADEVARLVLVTVDHRSAPDDPAGAWLCDADLAVLGGRPSAYDAYAADVRAEYDHIDEPAWRSGRATVLRSLLGTDPLFATVEGRRRWEQQARRNLAAELATLRT